jgi:hypothetical protein
MEHPSLDSEDFVVDSCDVYSYKIEFCLSELDVLGVDGWTAVILGSENVYFDPNLGANIQLWVKNSRLRLLFLPHC